MTSGRGCCNAHRSGIATSSRLSFHDAEKGGNNDSAAGGVFQAASMNPNLTETVVNHIMTFRGLEKKLIQMGYFRLAPSPNPATNLLRRFLVDFRLGLFAAMQIRHLLGGTGPISLCRV
jgi:hypothetical protein